jgi:pimeloyl-ACP methyl ester carboxylesterase
VAIVAHGFARSRERHRDLGRALAAAGVAAVIPDLPNVMNLWANGDALVDLVARVEAGTLGLPPVERARIVLIGTSAGGLASVLAAANTPGLAGWIGLDPVDRTGTGADAAARLSSPAYVLLGGSSPCNLFGSGRGIAGAVPAALAHTTKFKEASHCDFESPTNNLCTTLCGKASAPMQERVRAETVRAALALLAPPPAAEPPATAAVLVSPLAPALAPAAAAVVPTP